MSRFIWNWLFSFSIILSMIDADNSYLCPENFCTEENTVCYNFQCLPSCPSTTYVYERNCVKHCPHGLFSNGKECTTQCPIEKSLIQDGHCQSQCTLGRVLNNGNCAIECPTDMFLFNNSCVDVCPNTHHLTLNKSLATFGQNHKMVTKHAMTCVNECPDTTVKTSNSCLLECPDKMILFNHSCVDKCPLSHPMVLIRDTKLNSIPTCVAHCPPNKFRFGKTCVKDCPQDTLISHDTCVKNCTQPFPFLCRRRICSFDNMPITTNSICLSKCPTKHLLVQNSCFQYCYQSPSPYRIDDTCVKVCSKNLTVISGPERRCVDMCPDGLVKFKDQCIVSCPSDTMIMNGTCLSRCPETFPFRYKYSLHSWPYSRKITCVKSCPSGTFFFNKQCLQNCPIDTPAIQNRTCMINCTDKFPLMCIRNKCQSHYPIDKMQCLSKCPPNHKQFGRECFRHCFDTPLKYLENGTCVRKCSMNLTFGIERQCVDSCPENTNRYEDECVNNCPRNTFSFNKVCYETCPQGYPYKYVYITWTLRQITHVTCRKLCPNGTVSYNQTCVKHCPTGWFIFNSSCVEQCPSSHPFIYTIFGSVNEYHCVLERPYHALEMNNSFYSQCPDTAKFVFNRTCLSSCPEDHPFSQPVLLNNQMTVECVDACRDDTVLSNHTCVSNCPLGRLIFRRECVLSCPKEFSLVYVANRKFLKSPVSKGLTEETSFFCGRYCNREDVSNHFSSPCIYRGINEYHLFESSCHPINYSESFENIVKKCITKTLFENNGTFFENCPKDLKKAWGTCVDECPSDEPLFDPKSRRCLRKCVEKQFLYKHVCVENCPSKTFIISSNCMEIKKCPSDLPLHLTRKQQTYCLKQCPYNYFLDGNICVGKCSGKKVLGKTCTENCTDTHPFIMKDIPYADIPECFQECPDGYLGNVTSFECINDYDCKDFVFNKRCYKRCPGHTITVTYENTKTCSIRFYMQMELLGSFLIAAVLLFPCILCMCVEKGTPKRCYQRLTGYVRIQNQGIMDDENENLFQFDVQMDDHIPTDVTVENTIERRPEESSEYHISDAADGASHPNEINTSRQWGMEMIQSPASDESIELKVTIYDDS